ncbi:MAG: AsnC family transcriptional regulator [Candidatus Altiarchaeota archaeon]|nr:AsnC family transcriptional regulator [Candidatus Altiarchaeota archaeon]
MKVDKLDLSIIKHLQEDARLSFRELGQKLGVPHTTVFTRAERLLDRGVIKNFSAILHPHDLGLQIGYIIVDVPPSQSKDTANHIAHFEEARKVFRTFDGKIIVEVLVSGEHKGLEEFLARLNVSPVRVYPVHDVVKFDHKIHEGALNKLI